MPRRILLIDDDRLQLRYTQAQFKNFRAEQYDLDWAATYEEGIGKLLAGGYSACLLDYQLGARDGLELIREAMARGCRTPIIFLTAETSENIDIQAMHAGALDYLVKGEITPHMLERSLRYALKLGETLDVLHELATHDQLTGLFNRREFDRLLIEEVDRSRRFGRPFALVLGDIDHFKAVNDRHGHQAGDVVLREVAARLTGELRSVDRLARFGGEEMAMILMETDRATALETARRAGAALERAPIAAGGDVNLRTTMSFGVAVMPQDADSAEALVAAADKALYAAKARGRNCTVAAGEAA
ncbi:MAG TPA: diguanylate cyclase [Opitutaceae bacterium]|jgi:two-component system cell cycle response regulator|nr:diguanylate cyclase [Opitutaceae bacterium]